MRNTILQYPPPTKATPDRVPPFHFFHTVTGEKTPRPLLFLRRFYGIMNRRKRHFLPQTPYTKEERRHGYAYTTLHRPIFLLLHRCAGQSDRGRAGGERRTRRET